LKPAITIGDAVFRDRTADASLRAAGGKLAAVLSLTKPRIVLMVLITVGVGFILGARGSASPSTLVLTLLGTGMVAGGASALNQWLEQSRDALMRRTANRVLPSGRLSSAEALAAGAALGVGGTAVLLFGVNPIAAAVAMLTYLLYVFVYTPLKPVTTLNTVVGAVPGALPPVIGWVAATGRLGIEAWTLFLIMFLWQFPHFLAIAWIYRGDYGRAGFKMLSVFDPTGRATAHQSVLYALALVPAALLPAVIGLAGPFYFIGALGLSLLYVADAVCFNRDVTERTARRLLRTSYLYLPAILALLLLNPLPA
jgi:protoheme IX farnesyltransferase